MLQAEAPAKGGRVFSAVTLRPLQPAHAMQRSFRRLVNFCARAISVPRQDGQEVTQEDPSKMKNKSNLIFQMQSRHCQM